MYKLTTVLLAMLLSCSLSAQRLYVGTYNIRYNNSNDEKEGNAWAMRCPQLCDFINFEQPDIFGTQEALVDQLLDLNKRLDGYDYHRLQSMLPWGGMLLVFAFVHGGSSKIRHRESNFYSSILTWTMWEL